VGKKRQKGKEIFYVVGDYRACGWYRCHVPGLVLSERGHHVMLNSALQTNEISLLDVIVWQRQCSSSVIEAIETANSMGKTTVYEIDDNLWNLSKTNPAYEFWNRPGSLKMTEEAIRRVKVVTTTTPRLATLLGRFNPSVAILPNMLPEEQWRVEKKNKKKGERLVIGWAGGEAHWDDLKVLQGVIDHLLEEYPDIEFHIAGAGEVPLNEHERAVGLESVPIEDYAKLLRGFDIGLVPLADVHFNNCKSDLKFLEYAALGIPTVASKVDSYEASVIHGVNGFLAGNAKDWLKYLRRLIEEEDLRIRIGAKAKEFASTRMIEKNIGLWETAYGLTRKID